MTATTASNRTDCIPPTTDGTPFAVVASGVSGGVGCKPRQSSAYLLALASLDALIQRNRAAAAGRGPACGEVPGGIGAQVAHPVGNHGVNVSGVSKNV